MKTILCLLLVIFSFISYIGITPRLGIYMYHPIPHYLGMLVGIGLLVFLMKKKFTKRRLAATVFSVFLVGFFSRTRPSFPISKTPKQIFPRERLPARA